MESKKDRFLRLPRGTESIFLEEAYRHRRIVHNIEEIFRLWGYLPVQTPIFDYYEVYQDLIGREDEEKIYRLVDREGDILMLRSDVTLFLAKQISRIFPGDDLPVRLSYADSILRHQEAEDIQVNEFFQIGAELIGKADKDADLEILCLMSGILEDIGVKDSFIHLGNKRFFSAVFHEADSDTRSRFTKALLVRDINTVDAVLKNLPGISRAKQEFLKKTFLFIGTLDEFRKLIQEGRTILNKQEIEELRYLEVIRGEYAGTGLPENIRIDLSEMGTQPYHTGIAFQVYKTGIDSAIASGGRYDNLLKTFGFPAPSVGFSIMLRKIENHLPHPSHYYPPGEVDQAEGKTFAARYIQAKEKKKEGRIVIL
ncbi:MAG: ATP phosphoribosyltransferase regulatory subunit [Spirochaetia bacterium]